MNLTKFEKVYKNIILENEGREITEKADNTYQFVQELRDFFDFSFLKKEYPKYWETVEHDPNASAVKELRHFFNYIMRDKLVHPYVARSFVKQFYQLVKKLGWVQNIQEFKDDYINKDDIETEKPVFSISIISDGGPYDIPFNLIELLPEANKFIEWFNKQRDDRNKLDDLSDFDKE